MLDHLEQGVSKMLFPEPLTKNIKYVLLKSMTKLKEGGIVYILVLLAAVGIIAFLLLSNSASFRDKLFSRLFPKPSSQAAAIRGQPGDFWADIVIGKRDFTEISPREIVPYSVFNPGGAIVDRSVSPGRMYVWDSGNNRILGIDLAKCYASSSGCSADIVIGQPSTNDYGACNLDSSFQNYPQRAPASASTLCGVWEGTHTVLEDKSFSNMFVDLSGNLYVPDVRNHRILKYNSPFTTDTVADEVWGQKDFTGNECNQTGNTLTGQYGTPSNSSLCFISNNGFGAGVELDKSGNLWVADAGNHRVLRFPNGSKTADLVLGQPNFTSNSAGSGMNQMSSPNGIRLDSSGLLYVSEYGNNRVLVFTTPFTSGMSATKTIGSNITELRGIEIDPGIVPSKPGLWIYDNQGGSGGNARLRLWGFDGNLLSTPNTTPPEGGSISFGGGSVGIDSLGNLLVPSQGGNTVFRFSLKQDGSYTNDKRIFSPPEGLTYNKISNKRLESVGVGGVVVTSSQLVVVDHRLLYWNNPASLTNGQAADGFVGSTSFTTFPSPRFYQVKADSDGRIWASQTNIIKAFTSPLSSSSTPVKTISSPINVLGGGQLTFTEIFGIVPTSHSEFLWVSEPSGHRVFRIRDPLSATPVIDVILGQTSITGKSCNRGSAMTINTLCYPGVLSMDRKGNLYVSDHYLEVSGNLRLLMFQASTFPPNPSSVIFAPSATKEFPASGFPTFEAAFDSTNRMVIGYNPYSGKRFLEYFNNPTSSSIIPNGRFEDFYGWPGGITFDSSDNLYVHDANRGQVRIYKQPFLAYTNQVGIVNDSTSGATTPPANSTTLSWDHTTGSCANRILLVGVASRRGNSGMTSVTYGGANLTFIRSDTGGTDGRSELWYLVNPPTGTFPVQVNAEVSNSITAGASSWCNVSQSSPITSNAGGFNTTAGTNASVQINSAPDELVVDVVGTQNTATALIPAVGQTQVWNTQGSWNTAGASRKPGASSTTMSWTLSGPEFWALSAVSLKPAVSSPVSPPPVLSPLPTIIPTPLPVPTSSPTPTPAPGDVVTFSNFSVQRSTTSATITWDTNIPSTSKVVYGRRSDNLNLSTPEISTLTTSHSVNLTGLEQDKRYYYKVISKNSQGVEYSSNVRSFRTRS